MSTIFKAFFDSFDSRDPKVNRIKMAVLELIEAIADYTDTPLDDWFVARLRAVGVDDDTIDNFMKPERIQED